MKATPPWRLMRTAKSTSATASMADARNGISSRCPPISTVRSTSAGSRVTAPGTSATSSKPYARRSRSVAGAKVGCSIIGPPAAVRKRPQPARAVAGQIECGRVRLRGSGAPPAVLQVSPEYSGRLRPGLLRRAPVHAVDQRLQRGPGRCRRVVLTDDDCIQSLRADGHHVGGLGRRAQAIAQAGTFDAARLAAADQKLLAIRQLAGCARASGGDPPDQLRSVFQRFDGHAAVAHARTVALRVQLLVRD